MSARLHLLQPPRILLLGGEPFAANGLWILIEEPVPERDRDLGQRAIRDVFAGKAS